MAPVSDEEGGGDLWAAQVSASARRELRAMRLVSMASLLVAVMSAIALASMAFHSPAEEQNAGQSVDVIGLTAGRLRPGWHRTYLDSQVFATESLGAPAVQMLPVDSLVYVAEVRQQSVLIVKPVRGWMRALTEEGVEVLAPDETYSADPDKIDLEATSRSRRAREMNEVLQTRSRRAAALQQSIVDARTRLQGARQRAGKTLGLQVPRLASRAKQQIGKREQLLNQAAKALRGQAGKWGM